MVWKECFKGVKIFLDLKDKRFPYIDEYLINKKYVTDFFDKDNVSEIKSGDIVFVSPAFKFENQLIKSLPNNITIIAGNINPEFEAEIKEKNIKHINIMLNEDFVLKNANLTAEGMLCDLIANTTQSMYKENILIIGSGRVAKAVGYLFYKLGLNFDFAMRNEKEYNHMKLFSRKCFLGESYKHELKNYNVIINTVPALLFTQKDENKFKMGCYVFELASKRCLECINDKYLNYVLCPALPSKYAPKTAANLIIEVIKNYL